MRNAQQHERKIAEYTMALMCNHNVVETRLNVQGGLVIYRCTICKFTT